MLKVLSNLKVVYSVSRNVRCLSFLNHLNLSNDTVSNQHRRSILAVNLQQGQGLRLRSKYDKKGSRAEVRKLEKSLNE